ncbi:MAG: ribonuclease D, partial [Actinomycetota bacterium]
MADLTNYQWIDDDRRLVEVCASIASAERVAIDTEFHRERTYFPELALVQIAAPSGVYLIDPL